MMKKFLILFGVLIAFSLVSCNSVSTEITYSDDNPFVIEMKNDDLKILQLTDLHLTYGIDANDRKTLVLIDKLVSADEYDLIVISGDIALSISATSLFSKLIKHMETLKTPWTFIFGNHETDYNDYSDFINRISSETEYLYFKVGPEMVNGGYGNFRIQFTKDSVPFYNLYLMDSHSEMKDYTEEEGEYGYVSTAQVDWYESHVSLDTTDSILYMHIPLRQYMNPAYYVGTYDEKVCQQGVDTGLFDKILEYGLTKGVFVGHDHLNDFNIVIDGVYLAYGQVTGYNAYGYLERGGRVVHVDSSGVMTSYIVLESEVSS